MIFIEVPVGEPARIVNLHPQALRTILGFVSYAHPFEDEDIGLAHDDDGIANGRLPNRTVNGEIIPGPFYVVRISPSGNLIDLTPDDISTYMERFAVPEHFGSGHWTVHSKVVEKEHTCVLYMISEWVTTSEGQVGKDGEEP